MTPQGINKSFKDLQLSVGLADFFIMIRIHTDHGCNYIANQLLLSSLKQWFGRKGTDVNESKMWAFCFITRQTHISWILQLPPRGSFMHLFWYQRWCLWNNWNFERRDIAIRNCFLMPLLLWNGSRLFLPIVPALLIQSSVHQDRWRLLLRDLNRSTLWSMVVSYS